MTRALAAERASHAHELDTARQAAAAERAALKDTIASLTARAERSDSAIDELRREVTHLKEAAAAASIAAQMVAARAAVAAAATAAPAASSGSDSGNGNSAAPAAAATPSSAATATTTADGALAPAPARPAATGVAPAASVPGQLSVRSDITFPFQGYLYKFSIGKHAWSVSNWKKRYMVLEIAPVPRLRYLEKQDGDEKGVIPLGKASLIEQVDVATHDRSRHPEREMAIQYADAENNSWTLLLRGGSISDKMIWCAALKQVINAQQ